MYESMFILIERERVLEAVGAFVRSFAGVLALASKSLYTYTYLYNLITFQVVVIFLSA